MYIIVAAGKLEVESARPKSWRSLWHRLGGKLSDSAMVCHDLGLMCLGLYGYVFLLIRIVALRAKQTKGRALNEKAHGLFMRPSSLKGYAFSIAATPSISTEMKSASLSSFSCARSPKTAPCI